MPCPHYHPPRPDVANPSSGGLSQCTKYNRYPMRAIPFGGEVNCQAGDATAESCWLDFRSCGQADIARRIYEYGTLLYRHADGEPQIAHAATDEAGRRYYCLAHDGRWVHGGDHAFSISAELTTMAPPGERLPDPATNDTRVV